jgi:hypothetical protein
MKEKRPPLNQNCENCVFSVSRDVHQHELECHINPPQSALQHGRLGNWPVVMEIDWCGQWKDVL